MPHRYKESSSVFSQIKLRPFSALRESLRSGYSLQNFKSDLMAGIIVGMVAIPLAMALAYASGVAPQYGLYTVMIAGAVVALLGGSRFQVTGPTAAFVVILAPIVQKFGLSGLLLAGFMAGILLVLMGIARMGRLIQFIPHPVTTGFTAGIAVVIATLQMKDFFGLKVAQMPDHFFEKVAALFQARGTISVPELLIGSMTLALLILWPKINKKIPAPLIVLSLVTLGTVLFKHYFPEIDIATIQNRFSTSLHGEIIHGIPKAPPHFIFPWNVPSSNGTVFPLSFKTIEMLIPSAFAIAMLGAIESLLSAVVADGMARTHHDPDAELIALGTGNMLCPFFGGIAATGAIARTATNIRFGAKSPIAAMIHALFVFLVVLFFAPYVSYLPMASMAALLLLVAYNMSEVKNFVHIVKVAPRSDVIVLLLCFVLTVSFDMVIGVTVGVVFAAILFMQRMASVTSSKILRGDEHPELKETLPKEILLYEIAGPLFFGAAQSAMEAISSITDDIKIVIFDMGEVPTIDVTGLVAFETAVKNIKSQGKRVYLVDVKKEPLELLYRSGTLDFQKKVKVFKSLKEGVQWAKMEISERRVD